MLGYKTADLIGPVCDIGIAVALVDALLTHKPIFGSC